MVAFDLALFLSAHESEKSSLNSETAQGPLSLYNPRVCSWSMFILGHRTCICLALSVFELSLYIYICILHEYVYSEMISLTINPIR